MVGSKKRKSLRLITALIVSLSFFCFVIISYFILQYCVSDMLSRPETQQTLLLLLFFTVLFALAFYAIIVRVILVPIERLGKDIGAIGETGSVDMARYSGSRELSGLCSSVNGLLEKLNWSGVSLSVFKSILNGMDACLFVTDLNDDTILFANERMLRQHNIKEDVVGRRCWEVFQTGSDSHCSFCPLYRLMEDPTSVVLWEEENPDGHTYSHMNKLIELADGHLVHLQHSVDISQEKYAKQTLSRRLEQQELMSAISTSFISSEETPVLIDNALRMAGRFMDVSRILIGRINREEGVLLFTNEWVNEKQDVTPMNGLILPFAPGYSLHDAFLEQGAASVFCNDTELDMDFTYLLDVGIRAFIDVPIYIFGELWGLLCIDECTQSQTWSESDTQLLKLISSLIGGAVTRSRIEENLLRMSSIVDCSPLFISYVNTKGEYEYINQGATDITGYTMEELRTEGLPLIFDKKTLERVYSEYIPAVLEQGYLDMDIPLIRKDGEERIMEFTTFAVGKENIGIGVIASDKTDKQRLEQDLIAAKVQAEQSNQAKSDFLSRMSHEMRTPMNAIIGMTSIADGSEDLKQLKYCLSRISEASKHLLGVINDILDMSKIESGKLEITSAEFEFERVLTKAANVVNFRVDEKHQTLRMRVDQNVPRFLVGDEQRINQVITNLFSNAVKFTPEHGSITLDARLEDEADGLCTLRVSVTDTGIGISQESQKKLFRSFEQADGGISRRFGGTGLGLAICKSIVELMGGSIWVESEPGKGSSFIFTVRCGIGEEQIAKPAPDDINWNNVRILVVDDSADVRDYFAAFSESHGISCSMAANGEEALSLVSNAGDAPFHIIFVDWNMPGLNGGELAGRLTPILPHNSVVIMISSMEWSDIEQEARLAGVNSFLPKPLFSSRLVDCITECLSGEAGMSTLEAPLPEDYTNRFLGKRILLAEDVEINREIVLALLENTGVSIDCAVDGREALDAFRRDPSYDMIFMDIHMPEIDGYEATRQIRALPVSQARDVPIVAMTANVFREDVEKCLAAGMNAHVGKPIDLDEVYLTLSHFLTPSN